MKKYFVLMFLFAFVSNVHATNTSWIKGGKSFTDLNVCAYQGGGQECEDVDTEKEFFFQISPVNVRHKLDLDGAKSFGYRFEPWLGYSQSKVSESSEEDEISEEINATVKNIQFGANMFLDYTVMDDLEIYAGPMIGFELNEISGDFSKGGEYIFDTEYDTNFFYGVEAGAEYKIIKNVAIGGFASLIKHDRNTHASVDINNNNDLIGITNDLGNEIRAGASLIYFW